MDPMGIKTLALKKKKKTRMGNKNTLFPLLGVFIEKKSSKGTLKIRIVELMKINKEEEITSNEKPKRLIHEFWEAKR